MSILPTIWENCLRRIDDAHCGVENDFGQEAAASCVSGEKVSANIRHLNITGDRGRDTVQASDAAVCRAQGEEMSANIRALDFDASVCRADGEEVAANSRDKHNIGETGESMQLYIVVVLVPLSTPLCVVPMERRLLQTIVIRYTLNQANLCMLYTVVVLPVTRSPQLM